MEESLSTKIAERIGADKIEPIYSTETCKCGCIMNAQGNTFVIENIGGEVPKGTPQPYNDYADLYGIIAAFGTQRVYFCPNIQTDDSEHRENLELQTFGISIPLPLPNSDHDIRTARAFACIEAFIGQNKASDCPIPLYITDLSRQMLLPDSSSTADNLTAKEIIGEIDSGAKSAMMFVLSETAARATSREALAKWICNIYTAIPDTTERNRLKHDLNIATAGQEPQGDFKDLPPFWKIKACGITIEYLTEIDKYGLKGTKQARLLKLSAEIENSATMGDFSKMQDFKKEMDGIRYADGCAEVLAQLNAPRQEIEQSIAEHRNDLTVNYSLHDASYYGAGDSSNHIRERALSFSACGVSVICAAAKHGKTLFLLNTAMELSATGTVLFFSNEEDAAQINTKIYRALAEDLNIVNTEYGSLNGTRSLIRKNLTTGENEDGLQLLRRNFDKVREHLRVARIGSDIEQAAASIRTSIHHYRSKGDKVVAVFIDYLQLFRHLRSSYSRTDELSYICGVLNDLSKSEQLAIITAAQFNREAKRNGKLDDWGIAMIGESQSIENFATDVYMIICPDMIPQNPNDTGKRATIIENCRNEDGIMYIENLISREHRSGGVCVLHCDYSWGILGSEVIRQSAVF